MSFILKGLGVFLRGPLPFRFCLIFLAPVYPLPVFSADSIHTFIFFVQGSADHHVPKSMENFEEWGDADEEDATSIRWLARSCRSCNVVLLHIQRGKAGAKFQIYRRGMELFSENRGVMNGADPEVLKDLIVAGEKWFPDSDHHLIYRGHSFFYTKKALEKGFAIAPFDANYPDSPYGIEQFSEGIRRAQRTRPLASITLACCKMDFPEVRKELGAHAHYLNLTDRSILQTLETGFSYRFLTVAKGKHSSEEVSQLISKIYLEKQLP